MGMVDRRRGSVRPAAAPPERPAIERPAIGSSTREERQDLRHLLDAVLGSSTGTTALDFIERVLKRRVMVVGMSSTEIAVVTKALLAVNG